ncbi:MAG: DUF3348 family protein, partial [Achromobacter piechaudii]
SRLRGMVAAKNGEMTRLAVVDAIMDRALLPKERALLGAIPKLLQVHFDRLRLAEAATLAAAEAPAEVAAQGDGAATDGAAPEGEANAGTAPVSETPRNPTPTPANTAPANTASATTPPAVTPGAWLDVFRKDMRSVLLAELDVRLQPVEGLLAALRAS